MHCNLGMHNCLHSQAEYPLPFLVIASPETKVKAGHRKKKRRKIWLSIALMTSDLQLLRAVEELGEEGKKEILVILSLNYF